MNSKEQKIKEAYGEYWNFFKDKVNQDGWIKDREFWGCWPEGGLNKIEWQTTDHDNDYYDTRRPKSLQGIENNNGWLGGIPNEKGWYFIEYINKFCEPKEYNDSSEDFEWWKLNVVKYQKMFFPKQSIY